MAKEAGEKQPDNKKEGPSASVLSMAYALLIVAGGSLGLVCILMVLVRATFLSASTHLLSLGLGCAAFVLLAAQMAAGFPIERKFNENLAKERAAADQRKNMGIRPEPGEDLGRALGAGMIDIRYSFWLWISAAIAFLSIPALLLELVVLGYKFTRPRPRRAADTG